MGLYKRAEDVDSPQSSLVRRLSAKKRLSRSDSKSVLIATKAVCLESRGCRQIATWWLLMLAKHNATAAPKSRIKLPGRGQIVVESIIKITGIYILSRKRDIFSHYISGRPIDSRFCFAYDKEKVFSVKLPPTGDKWANNSEGSYDWQ